VDVAHPRPLRPRARPHDHGTGKASCTAADRHHSYPVYAFPPWAVALLVLGVLVLAAVGVLLLRMRRRSRAT